MRKTILYVAMSLDGYLADEKGGLTWLEGDGSGEENSENYEQFYESVDTIFMGRKTYTQIVEEFSPELWAYEGKKTYVFTHQEEEEISKEIQLTNRDPEDLLHWIKHRKGKDIWICGGAQLITQFLEKNLVDQLRINVVPCLLGAGVPLFPKNKTELPLKLVETSTNNGVVELIYEKR